MTGLLFSTKWLPRVDHVVVFKTKVCISRLKIHTEREISKNAQFPFREQTKAFRYEIVQGIRPCFLQSRRSDWPVLIKCNLGSEVFEEFSGTFYSIWSRKVRF